MKTRIISGAVLFGILISTLCVGGLYLFFFCLVASVIGMYELYRIFDMQFSVPAWIGYCTATTLYIFLITGVPVQYEIFLYVLSLIALLVYFVFSYPQTDFKTVIVALFAIFYVAFMLSFIFRLRIMPGGASFVWLIFLGSWVNDTCAYFTGYFLGKHKMTPLLSPKKTWEGAAGGIAGATIVGLIYGIIMANVGVPLNGNVIGIFVLAGALGSVAGIIGDLAASAIKRQEGIKDYGTLIPGHGGILDRFDSVILVAPIVYWIINITGVL